MDATPRHVDPSQDSHAPPGFGRAPKLAIVIVTYNSAPVLAGLLDSIPSGLEGIRSREVVVVDNDSHDGSAGIAEAHPVGARVIRMGRNAGYAAGINAASETIAADMDILILNPDIRLQQGCGLWLSRQLSDPSVGIAVPQMLNEDETVAKSIRKGPTIITIWADALLGAKLAARIGLSEIVADPGLYRSGGAVEWATGAALAISARARRAVGPWDESFFLYSEEVDYMERVRRTGLKVVYEVNARVVHFGGEYHENTFLSALMTANRIRYYRRHHGPLATMVFRLGIIIGETMRFTLGPGHRAALRAAMSPTARP
jgi:GT2 family glycosyltransferase